MEGQVLTFGQLLVVIGFIFLVVGLVFVGNCYMGQVYREEQKQARERMGEVLEAMRIVMEDCGPLFAMMMQAAYGSQLSGIYHDILEGLK